MNIFQYLSLVVWKEVKIFYKHNFTCYRFTKRIFICSITLYSCRESYKVWSWNRNCAPWQSASLSGSPTGEDQHSTHTHTHTQANMRKDEIKIVSLKINEVNSFHHISKSVVKKAKAEKLFCWLEHNLWLSMRNIRKTFSPPQINNTLTDHTGIRFTS